MPAWLALVLGIAGAGVVLAGLWSDEVARGWNAARRRWRDAAGRRAALRQLEREGWRRP